MREGKEKEGGTKRCYVFRMIIFRHRRGKEDVGILAGEDTDSTGRILSKRFWPEELLQLVADVVIWLVIEVERVSFCGVGCERQGFWHIPAGGLVVISG